MTLLQDAIESAKLPKDWKPGYKGLHPTTDGMGFVLEWNYPWKMRLSGGKRVTFSNYAEHTKFVRMATTYYEKHGVRHPMIDLA